MASTSLAKDLKTFEDFDIDELLSKLTPEEIEELSNDIDPDVRSPNFFHFVLPDDFRAS